MSKGINLSITSQIKVLKRLRRECPFVVLNGPYGYTCGGLKNGVRSSSGMGAQSKEAHRCNLSCNKIRLQAFRQAYNITVLPQKLIAL